LKKRQMWKFTEKLSESGEELLEFERKGVYVSPIFLGYGRGIKRNFGDGGRDQRLRKLLFTHNPVTRWERFRRVHNPIETGGL